MKIWRKVEVGGSIFIILFGGLYLYFLSANVAFWKQYIYILLTMEVVFLVVCEIENRRDCKGKKRR